MGLDTIIRKLKNIESIEPAFTRRVAGDARCSASQLRVRIEKELGRKTDDRCWQ